MCAESLTSAASAHLCAYAKRLQTAITAAPKVEHVADYFMLLLINYMHCFG